MKVVDLSVLLSYVARAIAIREPSDEMPDPPFPKVPHTFQEFGVPRSNCSPTSGGRSTPVRRQLPDAGSVSYTNTEQFEYMGELWLTNRVEPS